MARWLLPIGGVRLVLGNFRALEPAHEKTQAECLAWLAAAHARAEATRAAGLGRACDEERFRAEMARRLARFGCGPDKIESRGHEIADFEHTRFEDMEVYRLCDAPAGRGMLERTRVFARVTEAALERLFENVTRAPGDLVHVTCTGYDAPSAAQRLVASRGWGAETRVTHAYHMGCYAALPALRIAAGFLSVPRTLAPSGARRCEIVHTELSTLHLNPLVHTAEQLVIQSLFADGCIAYALEREHERASGGPGLALLAEEEHILSGTEQAMTWTASDFGMQMTLAPTVPGSLAEALGGVVARLAARAELSAMALGGALYAVHPGGPKVLDRVRAALRLDEAQIAGSRALLRRRGNMSSATLPHIWMDLVRDPTIVPGTLVVSLAFGPGLTVSAAVMQKTEAP
nr:MAG: naringenin-chalcone synthase [Pseudomonadota bacterium]